jgi:hypothetical protein
METFPMFETGFEQRPMDAYELSIQTHHENLANQFVEPIEQDSYLADQIHDGAVGVVGLAVGVITMGAAVTEPSFVLPSPSTVEASDEQAADEEDEEIMPAITATTSSVGSIALSELLGSYSNADFAIAA